jgi:hypothetical protein
MLFMVVLCISRPARFLVASVDTLRKSELQRQIQVKTIL